ncbi:MAG: exodeoxyribonuclease V subunit gamma [Chlamydiia bacterium]|nr:exodeoxyribonuclease V subunit gamma [Chlamydiia bacterium]
MGKLFLSHRLDYLAARLAEELSLDTRPPLALRRILVPHACLKQWLLVRLADCFDGIAGCRILTMEEGLRELFPPSEQMPKASELICAIFSALEESQEAEVLEYCQTNRRRLAELSWTLMQLFERYELWYPGLLMLDAVATDWQTRLIRTLTQSGILRLKTTQVAEQVHCFGFNVLPPSLWKLLSASSIYLFSPCRHFWGDLCTDLERKQLGRYWKKRGASENAREELDRYLREAPPLLANWGKGGRETLRVLERLDLQTEEDDREEPAPISNLEKLQRRLLDFVLQPPEEELADSSLQITKTGASPLREIEHVRSKILRLAGGAFFQYADVSVLAPDIQPFIPFIELIFHDLPIRIIGSSLSLRSSFYQGMCCLLDLASEGQGLIKLFENTSFRKALDWGKEETGLFRRWVQTHRKEEAWENELLDQYIYLFPEQNSSCKVYSSELIEKWLCAIKGVQKDVCELQRPHTLPDWAALLARCAETYFFIDQSIDTEGDVFRAFQKTVREFAESTRKELYPLELIQKLVKRPSKGDLHASHLHAIRFASMEEGAIVPSRFLFFIGMDEESFPRQGQYSSLDLLRKENIYTFEVQDRDRYLFLQALFSAKQQICFSYNHISREEGKPLEPSPLIRELGIPLQEDSVEEEISLHPSPARIRWPVKPVATLPEGVLTISLADLKALARHPWNFFLQKTAGIYVEGREQDSFVMQRGKMLRSALLKPVEEVWQTHQESAPGGICGRALEENLAEAAAKWKGRMEEWGAEMESLFLRLHCRKAKREEKGWEMPPVEMRLSASLKVKIFGDVRLFSSKGFLHAGDDSIEGLLPVWPECLVALHALGCKEIRYLKSGKTKTIDNPTECLHAYLHYFFLSLSAPSPLLPEWSDALLRKTGMDGEKKALDRTLGKGNRFDDPVFDWVLSRVDLPAFDAWFSEWQPLLKEPFAGLCKLYPKRGQDATV